MLSHDLENSPDIVALIGASAALTISGVPFLGPVAAARVGYKDGQFILNPPIPDFATSELELVVAGTKEGVLMVESEAKELPEDIMLQAVMFGHKNFQPVIDLIINLAEMCAKEPRELPPPAFDKKALVAEIKSLIGADLTAAYNETVKQVRYDKLDKAREVALAAIPSERLAPEVVNEFVEHLKYEHVRHMILSTGRRIDGRDTKSIRPIVCEVRGPAAHTWLSFVHPR